VIPLQSSTLVRFPVRAAAVDIGSNAIRYVVAEVSEAGTYTEVESERLAVRLGKDVFSKERRFSASTLEAAVDALGRVRRRLDDLGIAHYRAVATSAVRESRNGGELVDRIRREAGIHVETISGSEEARLVWLAVGSRLPLGPDPWLLMDLGGGSLEVSVVNEEGILWSVSHTLGTVRLLNAFEEEEARVTGADFRELLERYVHVLKVPAAVADWMPVGTVATGGNIEALAGLAVELGSRAGVPTLPTRELRRQLNRLAGLTFEERMETLGLREDRADVILPAAVIYERVADLAGANEILVPGVGVKEGLVLDLVDDLRDRSAHEGRRRREIFAGAVALGRQCRFDEAHARKVAELALGLFDQLKALHGLDSRARRILLAGALLHDVGQFISYRRHHKHSMYLIANSELPGLTSEEVRLAAVLARYHRRAEPAPGHRDFDPLTDEDGRLIRHLAALLRVADALDREHVSRVAHLQARVLDTEIVLGLETRTDLALEDWALRKKGRLFQEVFGRDLRLEVEPRG
jgi:exopolyphosphatase / guanosine-5'-triphosphate,3'-diphosphate pyrophosphatase